MDRRAALSTVGTAAATALAGCADGFSDAGRAEAESVVAQFDGAPDRPECERESETVEVEFDGETREFETAATVPYPDPPAAFTRDAVLDYVSSFERAYVTQDILCDRRGSGYIFSIEYRVRERDTFDWYEDIAVVFLHRAGVASEGSSGDGVWVADVVSEGVVYAVDETGVARAEFDDRVADGEEPEAVAPDPLEAGDLLATFD